MARLYLITHAHTQVDAAVDAVHWQLSPDGEAQAAALATLPWWADVDRILVSAEAKTRLTVAPLLAKQRLPVREDSRFDEVLRPGWVETYSDQVRAFFAAPAQSIGGWEPADHARQRFLAGLRDHLAPAREEQVALVSHGLVLSLYRAHLLGQPFVEFAAWRALPFAAVAIVDPSTPTLVEDFEPVAASPARAAPLTPHRSRTM